MEKIEYLYHYTSLESLALILKNRTIRLNSLDKMDDLQEQKTADIDNIGKFVFVSSWTDDFEESIPMWKMYTDPKAGVRIRLRKNPFYRHGTRGSDVAKAIGAKAVNEDDNDELDTFLDLSKMMSNGYISPQGWSGDILKKVEYTDDIEKLEPKVGNLCKEKLNIDIGKMGIYKNTYWEFQHEWRYIMTFCTMDFKSRPEAMLKIFSEMVGRLYLGKEEPPFRYFDLDIDQGCFEEMEITCSPQMSLGNRVLIESLVEKYNPKAKILESELFGKI